jgi:lysophospholipase L1-like esterase
MQVSSRKLGGGVIVGFGAFVLLSALILNPLVGRVWRGLWFVDYSDAFLSYFLSAVVIGIMLVGLGIKVMQRKSAADECALVLIVIGSGVLFDRALLARFGLDVYTYDSELQYRLRPHIERTLTYVGRPQDHIVTNRWGFHDKEFPLEKPSGEFRALMLGDSVTMGYGVTYAETFSAQLEALLDNRDRRFAKHRIINTGVNGYNTYQERIVFDRSLNFRPDIVFLGFCMNDVTEPMVYEKRFGGAGYKPDGGIEISNPLIGWLANETGIGQAVKAFARRGKQVEAEKRFEVYNVRSMAAGSLTVPKMQEAWRTVLDQLSTLYEDADQNRVHLVLLIFPYTFQLADGALRLPQQILASHAAKYHVDVIDTTDNLANAVFDDPDLVAYLRGRGKTPDEILSYHEQKVKQYFIDEDHFTIAGHRVVARRIFEYLRQKGLIAISADALTESGQNPYPATDTSGTAVVEESAKRTR